MSNTCHLSGFRIEENEEVLVFPIIYGDVLYPTQLVYTIEDNIYPLWMPIEAKMGEYGVLNCINHDIESNKMFYALINEMLVTNKKRPERFQMHKFCMFQSAYNEPEHGEFINQERANKLYEEKKLFEIDEFGNIEKFFSYVSKRAVFDYSSRGSSRVGAIYIKKSFLLNFIDKCLTERLSKLKEKSIKFFNEIKDNYSQEIDFKSLTEEEFQYWYSKRDISVDYVKNELMGIFNGCNGFFYLFIRQIKKSLNNKSNFDVNSLIDSMMLYSAINMAYESLGKSYYPNSERRTDLKGIVAFAECITEYANQIQERNF